MGQCYFRRRFRAFFLLAPDVRNLLCSPPPKLKPGSWVSQTLEPATSARLMEQAAHAVMSYTSPPRHRYICNGDASNSGT